VKLKFIIILVNKFEHSFLVLGAKLKIARVFFQEKCPLGFVFSFGNLIFRKVSVAFQAY
jgi:hypothetical protein